MLSPVGRRPGGRRSRSTREVRSGHPLPQAILLAGALLALGLWGRLLPPALAAAGDLDPSFGTGGKRVVEFNVLPPVSAAANGMAPKPFSRK